MRTKTLLLTYTALIALLSLTVGLAFVNLGSVNLFAAMLIAAIKASLVLLIFMELRHAIKTTKLLVGVFLLWGMFFGLLGSIDYFSRSWAINPLINEKSASLGKS